MTNKNKNIEIKNKFINHLIINGKKNKSEKILYQSIKTLQTNSKKASKKLLQLALIYSTPIFKLNTIKQTKRKKKKQKSKIIPAFIWNQASRVSFAIRFVIETTRKKKHKPMLKKLTEEFLLSAQNKNGAIELKKETQKHALLNRHLFKYYRWH